MTLDKSFIYLEDLRFHAYHGVMPQEHLAGNDYSVDLRIGYDISKAMISDDVADTLNYAEAYRIVDQEMGVPSQLLERVAYRICDRLMRKYTSIDSVDIKITKLNPPFGADCKGAGIELHLINDKT